MCVCDRISNLRYVIYVSYFFYIQGVRQNYKKKLGSGRLYFL